MPINAISTRIRSAPTGHDDDYDDYDDEVDTGLTSRQAQKYMYDRNRSAAADHSDEDEDDDAAQLAALSDEQRATLQSCIDQIRDVLGDVLTQSHMSQIVLTHAFDADQSLDAALQAAQRSQAAATAKAQRSKATPPRQQQATKADKGERLHLVCVCVFAFFCLVLTMSRLYSLLLHIQHNAITTAYARSASIHPHALEQGKMRVH